MTVLNTDKVRELYSAAVSYDNSNLRKEVNEAEFNDWLRVHDAEEALRLLEGLLEPAQQYVKALGYGDAGRVDPVIKLMSDRAEEAQAVIKASTAAQK